MPRIARERSAIQIRRLSEPGYHAVGGCRGLYLQITPSGGRSWVLRTTVGGKRRDIGLGSAADVTLKEAREKGRAVREQIRQGIDPVAERRVAQATLRAEQAKAITFEQAARKCHAAKAAAFRNHKHRNDWISSLQRHAFQVLGNMYVGEIELPHVLRVLEPMWEERTETATRVRQRIESVLTWATVRGYRAGENPARWEGNLKEVLPAPRRIANNGRFRALPWHDVPAFMEKLREREGMAARALEFAILTAARSGEVRKATWDEIDFDAKLWTVPAERIKAGREHKVPLSNDAIKLLRSLPRMQDSPYVFPAPRGGPLSDMSISAVCRRMKVDAVPHGFRSSFKDWARNRTRYADEVSELALAHVSTDATRAAYARDELLQHRARLMRDWARFLREPPAEGTVTPIHQRGQPA